MVILKKIPSNSALFGLVSYNDPCRLLLSFEILPNCLELECQDSHVKIPQAKVQCAAMVRFLRISEPNQPHRLCLMKKDLWPRRSHPSKSENTKKLFVLIFFMTVPRNICDFAKIASQHFSINFDDFFSSKCRCSSKTIIRPHSAPQCARHIGPKALPPGVSWPEGRVVGTHREWQTVHC